MRKFTPKGKFYRLNFFIQARELRLLDETGKMIGVVTKEEALRRGREAGVDVVEIAPNAKPPVAKLIDYKKFKYLEAKKEKDEKKNQNKGGIKEIRMRPFIDDHDLNVKLRQARGFLENGNQLKVSIPFRGREITRREYGFSLLNRFLGLLENAKLVRPGKMEGKVLVAMIAPDKKGKQATSVVPAPEKI